MANLLHAWLSRWLFRLTLLLSAALIVLVLFSPLLDNEAADTDDWRRVIALFARDATLRRTAVASAIGLLVTACVFFRPSGAPPPVSRQRKQAPPPPGVAGA